MKRTPSVCIIIVNYNNASDTIECLESLEKVNYPNYEVIVVDNCSSEREELDTYLSKSRYRLLQLEENLGFAGGNNAGIKLAIEAFPELDYLLLLNNDTIVDPDFLGPLVEECASSPDIGGCCSHINYYDRPEETWYSGGGIRWLIGTPFHKEDVRQERDATDEGFLTGCVFLFPVHLIEEVGYLPEDYFLYFEDVAYSLEIKKANYRLRYVPQSLVYHKVQATTGYRSPLSNYYGTRNNLLFMSRYSKKTIYPIFFVYFIVKNAVKYVLYFLKGKEFYSIREAIVCAFIDYFRRAMGKRVQKAN
ncbi:glycosyltransferase family 2 protein [Alkalihalobacillus sp. CinArs1]|uniref:glycosyltransferase family 2 protein n=1 Tax=Alkalihalobacillus sp. CinArs1 TaxID=2995314 RepID=UPI0022DD8823|nr:glycosyltransferase family 2 protein [Alkalihalobacillus sp. CinArs1]